MRIPVYRSRIQATNEAPGRAFQTRKRAQPFVQAAIDKGKVGQALTSSIGDYALYRYNMAEQLKLDKLSIEAKDRLRNLRFDLSQRQDTSGILDGDKPEWNSETQRIKKDILSRLGKNKNALQKFEATFLASESDNKFALRGAIAQTNITESETVSAAKFTSLENDLNNTYNTVDDYNQKVALFLAEEGARSETDEFKIKLYNAQRNIAENVTRSFISNDSAAAIELETTLDAMMYIEQLRKAYGKEDGSLDYSQLSESDIATIVKNVEETSLTIGQFQANYGNGAEYMLYTLMQLPEGDRNDIATKIFKEAISYEDNVNKFIDRQEELNTEFKEATHNNFVTIDETDTYSSSEIKNLMPIYRTDSFAKYIIDEYDFGEEDEITGLEAQKLLHTVLKETANATQVELDTMEAFFFDAPKPFFAKTGDPVAEQNLITLQIGLVNGSLKLSDIQQQLLKKESFITETGYKFLNSLAESRLDEAVSNALKFAQFHYKTSDDPDTSNEFQLMKRNSYYSVSRDFLEVVNTTDKSTQTRTFLHNEMNRIMEENKVEIVANARKSLRDQIENININNIEFGVTISLDPNLSTNLEALREQIKQNMKVDSKNGDEMRRDLIPYIEFIEDIMAD